MKSESRFIFGANQSLIAYMKTKRADDGKTTLDGTIEQQDEPSNTVPTPINQKQVLLKQLFTTSR